MLEKRFPDWYKVYWVFMKIRNVLGSVPEKPQELEFVKKHYMQKFGVDEQTAEEMMDVYEATYEHVNAEEAEVRQRCVFRRNEKGEPYFAYGQIIGWLEEAIKAANLSRKIKNVALTFTTDPREIVPKKYEFGEDAVRPVRSYVRGQYITTLVVNECMKYCELEFYLLTTNMDFDRFAEQVFDVGWRVVGFGPGRNHGFGLIEELKWKKIQ